MEELFKLISNYGFPVAVAAYLLFRQEKKMDDLTDIIKGKDGILDKLEELFNLVKDKLK